MTADKLRTLVYGTTCSALSPLDRNLMASLAFEEYLDDGDERVRAIEADIEEVREDRDEWEGEHETLRKAVRTMCELEDKPFTGRDGCAKPGELEALRKSINKVRKLVELDPKVWS